MTRKVQLLLFPDWSLATTVTTFVPTGKVEPLVGVAVTLVTPQASEANVAVGKVTTVLQPTTVLVIMSAGHAIVGACKSRTTTLKVQLLLLPDWSLATTITTFVPVGKVEP